MHVFKIIAITFLLLFSAATASAQEEDDDASESITPPKKDSILAQPHSAPFDIKGTQIAADSTVAFGADSVLKADTSTIKGPKHTAMKAVWRSAVCPGLGQAYNRKYWKIPIIYAGFGGLGYALYYTSHNFNIARTAYRAVVRGQPASYLGYTAPEDIKYFRDQYKNYLNICALVTVVWYGLNLIDAAVDGHLYSYNMDDKLSFNFDPSFMLQNPLGVSQSCMGLTFTLKPGSWKQKPVNFMQ